MRILIINDYLKYGGAEIQSLREKKILEENGHEVMMITLDEKHSIGDENFNRSNGFINIPVEYSVLRRNLNRLGISLINKKLHYKINGEIQNFSPDIIHANNVNKEPFTIYDVLKKRKTVQTVRDYSAVCPKGTSIKNNGVICDGYRYSNCMKECGKNIIQRSRFTLWNRIRSTREKNIQRFIAPSMKLTEFCKNNDLKTVCINNPFDFSRMNGYEKKTDFSVKKYLYYGAINKNKGIIELIDAFKLFQEDKSVELIIAGKLMPDVRESFHERIKNEPKIKYIGELDYIDMLKTLEKVYTIVVPSIWMENYPNTVLEGQSLKILVIGSNRGGIPEMLEDGRGYTFNISSIHDIIDKLEKTYRLSETE